MRDTNGFYKDLTGQRFGHLVVVGWAGQDKRGKSLWLTRCDCGQKKEIVGHALKSLKTKSCGCSQREYMKAALGKHQGELTGAKWSAILFNAQARNHVVSITQKQAADLFERQGHLCALSGKRLILDAARKDITASLDRIDSNKGYTLDNVQWIHKDINRMKNVSSEVDFLGWVSAIARYKNLT